MSLTVSFIKSRVKAILDEVGVNEQSYLSGSSNANLDSVIVSKIEDAAQIIYQSADIQLLDIEQLTGSGSASKITVSLGGDFLRFISAKLESWNYPVYDLVWEDSGEYAKLNNQYTTGTASHPKAALVMGSSGKSVELYGNTNGTSVNYTVNVIKKRKLSTATGAQIADADTITIGDALVGAVMYCIAGMVLQTYRDEHADSLIATAFSLAGIKTTN